MISSSQQDFQDYGNDAITCHQETEIATISTTFSSVSYLLCLKAIYYLERFSKLMSDCPYRMTRRHTDIVCAYFPYLDMTILKKKAYLIIKAFPATGSPRESSPSSPRSPASSPSEWALPDFRA